MRDWVDPGAGAPASFPFMASSWCGAIPQLVLRRTRHRQQLWSVRHSSARWNEPSVRFLLRKDMLCPRCFQSLVPDQVLQKALLQEGRWQEGHKHTSDLPGRAHQAPTW